MKRNQLRFFAATAVTAVGVLLGRGALADTILTFDARPAGQGNNVQILQSFGDTPTAVTAVAAKKLN